MLTPQEIKTKKFEKAVFGGYDMAMVDDFLDMVLADYSALYKDNAVLKGKMKVLVDKIEEYRSVDEAMRKALLSAQNMANEMISGAKKQSEELEKGARQAAEDKLREYGQKIAEEERRLAHAKEEASRVIDSILQFYDESAKRIAAIRQEKGLIPEKQMESPPPPEPVFAVDIPQEIEQGPDLPAPAPAPERPDYDEMRKLSGDRGVAANPEDEDTVELKTYERADVREVNLPLYPIAEEEPEFTPKPKFKFENLRFGTSYDEEDLGKK